MSCTFDMIAPEMAMTGVRPRRINVRRYSFENPTANPAKKVVTH